ncbi:hypothetical protein OSTOST_15684 [Ostertagia ostertagi]
MGDHVAKSEDPLREQKGVELRVVKQEVDEEAETCATASTSEIPPANEVVAGYEETERGGVEPSNRVSQRAAAETASNLRAGQATREIFELSPLERRIRQNRGYNENDWTSEELKALYEG